VLRADDPLQVGRVLFSPTPVQCVTS
jgi:hypothetical protein